MKENANTLEFRELRADEIECRVAMVKANGVSLLLYKDARCDMNILDETVGPMNWKRHHTRDNANCVVSIWDDTKSEWVSKEDTGTESFTEKEKGLASDSFKRACFNWGIGRELYTAPFIWVPSDKCVIAEKDKTKKIYTCGDRFFVEQIKYQNKKISELVIGRKDKNGKTMIVFSYPAGESKKADTESGKAWKMGPSEYQEILKELSRTGLTERKICIQMGIATIDSMTKGQYEKCMATFKKTADGVAK